MGRMSELHLQMQEDERGVKLAELLNISYIELDMLKYEIHQNESKDGLLYNYRVEFSKDSPREILDKIEILESDGYTVYLDTHELDTSKEEYYEEHYEAIISNKNFYANFFNEIKNIEKLNELDIEDSELKEILNRQIFISVFGTLETFLSDTFINLTIKSDEYLRNFVESHPEFKQRKFELKDVFESYSRIKDTAKKVMIDTIYHDLPKVKEMYAATFKIEFPELKEIMKLVSTRHDLVHRNGKTKEDEKVIINKIIIKNLINLTSEFVERIALKLKLKDKELPW